MNSSVGLISTSALNNESVLCMRSKYIQREIRYYQKGEDHFSFFSIFICLQHRSRTFM